MLKDFIHTLFPDCCIVCSQTLITQESHLCLHCEQELPLTYSHQHNGMDLSQRFFGRIRLSSVNAYLKFYHEGIVQKLSHQIKYDNNPDLATYLGKKYGEVLKAHLNIEKEWVLVPVPLHKRKLLKRGYNQSMAFALGLSETLGLTLDENLLIRIKPGSTQTNKSRMDRWDNVSAIFRTTDSVEGKKIILVDDVLTTGATLEACGQALVKQGCKELSIIVLASAM